jgi:hypothetical protein
MITIAILFDKWPFVFDNKGSWPKLFLSYEQAEGANPSH